MGITSTIAMRHENTVLRSFSLTRFHFSNGVGRKISSGESSKASLPRSSIGKVAATLVVSFTAYPFDDKVCRG